jgi:hypothetical protein
VKGQFEISDIILYLLFFMIIAAFFLILSIDTTDQPPATVLHDTNVNLAITSYLHTPINMDVDRDGSVDAKTVADLIAMGATDATARSALETELYRLFRDVHLEERRVGDTGTVYGILVEYPNGQEVRNHHGFSKEDAERLHVPLSNGKHATIYVATVQQNTYMFSIPLEDGGASL